MKKILLLTFVLCIGLIHTSAQNSKSIIEKTISVLSPSNSYKYTFVSTERINGEIVNSTIETKVAGTANKIYLNNIAGKNKGKELLYVKGENKNKVLVNVAWGVSLSPFNSLLRKGNHHIILDSGFKSVRKTLNDANKRAIAENRYDEVFKYNGKVTFNGKECYKITITDPTFTYTNYTLKNSESLYQLAIRKNICENIIVEKNSNLSSFDSAKDGLTIKIPTSYAKTTILYIDTKTYHPIYQEMHDEKGMFEKYSYNNLIVNPKFAENEFTKDFPEYNF